MPFYIKKSIFVFITVFDLYSLSAKFKFLCSSGQTVINISSFPKTIAGIWFLLNFKRIL